MALVVLKDRTYQQYQENLRSRAQAAGGAAGHPLPSPYRGMLMTGLHWACISAAAFVVLIVLYVELGLSEYLAPAPFRAPAAVLSVPPASVGAEPSASNNPLWRCGQKTYTNAPGSAESCEFVAAPQEHDNAVVRFITPSRSTRS